MQRGGIHRDLVIYHQSDGLEEYERQFIEELKQEVAILDNPSNSSVYEAPGNAGAFLCLPLPLWLNLLKSFYGLKIPGCSGIIAGRKETHHGAVLCKIHLPNDGKHQKKVGSR